MKTFPIPSAPAPSGGEDNPKPMEAPPISGGTRGYAKGGMVKSCGYAKGGEVLGRTRDFIKEPDAFRTDTGPGAKQDYGK